MATSCYIPYLSSSERLPWCQSGILRQSGRCRGKDNRSWPCLRGLLLLKTCNWRLSSKERGGQGGPLERQLEQQLRGSELQRLRLEAAHAEQTIEDLRAVLRASLERPPDPGPPCQGPGSGSGHANADGEASSRSLGHAGHEPEDGRGSPAASHAAEPALRRSAPVLALNPLWVPDGGARSGLEESTCAGFGQALVDCEGVAGGLGGLAAGGFEPGMAACWGMAARRSQQRRRLHSCVRLEAWRVRRCLRAWLHAVQAARLAASQALPRLIVCHSKP